MLAIPDLSQNASKIGAHMRDIRPHSPHLSILDFTITAITEIDLQE